MEEGGGKEGRKHDMRVRGDGRVKSFSSFTFPFSSFPFSFFPPFLPPPLLPSFFFILIPPPFSYIYCHHSKLNYPAVESVLNLEYMVYIQVKNVMLCIEWGFNCQYRYIYRQIDSRCVPRGGGHWNSDPPFGKRGGKTYILTPSPFIEKYIALYLHI